MFRKKKTKNRLTLRLTNLDKYTKLGLVIFIAGGAVSVIFYLVGQSLSSDTLENISNLIRPFTLYFAGKYLILGRRRSAKTASELRKTDERAPVLLLRSFSEDVLPIKTRWVRFSFWESEQFRDAITFERVLTTQVEAYGPVIAIGKPNTNLPPLGAAREFFSDEEWQKAVETWMRESKMVIIVLGLTESVQWELLRLIELNLLQKVIVVFPPTDLDNAHTRYLKLCKYIEGFENDFPSHKFPTKGTAILLFKKSVPFGLTASTDEWAYEVVVRVAAKIATQNEVV